ncbi:UPF0118 membrane protein ydbI [Listeria aquatica FSL S10-1188]|uniref:UPF0118 membrane protein ydbI n=1 Tax=Listeria aquatica FSL S10-1188 TaxID=1265818 RepID=W7BJ90_9LIST|nr:UPF0118 membrane protein ydbI [Listeria aquatica FSL S10-1188]
MEWLSELLKKDTLRRLLVFVLLGLVLYFVRSMIDLIILTFIFAFLVTRLENVILKRIRMPRKLIVIVLYVAVAAFFICCHCTLFTHFDSPNFAASDFTCKNVQPSRR